MAANSGESQLQRIIRDLQDAVTELHKEFAEVGEPITDDCISLHKFSYKLEYLLQFDQKEKSTLLGNRKDYWDYFCDCLAKVKGTNDGIRFVKSISELRTSVGKGRAFIRYSLVHQRLADTLQQCFMNAKVTSDWYYARSPFLNPKMSSDIVGHLYELTEVQFDLASRGYDLDTAWPTFARRTLSSFGSSSYLWKPPSRSSSMNSLAQDIPSSPNGNHFLSNEPLDGLEELHVELDQAELRQKELQDRIQQLEKENRELQTALGFEKQQAQMEREKTKMISEENGRLTKLLGQLEKQCEFSHSTQDTVKDLQKCLQILEENAAEKQKLKEVETSKNDCHSELLPLNQEVENTRTLAAMKDACVNEVVVNQKSEEQNNDLIAKASALVDAERQQATDHFESALKTEELLEKLHIAEQEKSDSQKLNEKYLSQLKNLEEQLLLKENTQKDFELRMQSFTVDSKEESEKLHSNLEAMAAEMATLQKELAEKEKIIADLQGQMKDTLSYVNSLEEYVGEEKKGKEKLEGLFSFTKTTMEHEVKNMVEPLEMLEMQLSKLSETVKTLEEQKKELTSEREHLRKTIEGMEKQATEQSLSLKKLQQTNQKLDEKCRQLAESQSVLEADAARLQASEKQLRSHMDDSVVSADGKKQGENKPLDENLQKVTRENRVLEEKLKTLQDDYQEQSEETTKGSLNLLQTELQGTKDQHLQMEQCLSTSGQHEDTLKLQLMGKDEVLRRLENQCRESQRDADALRKKAETLEVEKVDMEKALVEQAACQQKEVKDVTSRLAISEEQLLINQEEVARLQEEIMDLQAKLRQASAEQQKLQEQLDVRGTVLGEHKDMAQQLQEQNERLNRNHVQELLQYKEQEEALKRERDQEAHQKAELEKKLLSLSDELSKVKQCLEAINLENMEVKDLLNRTNTDMAELGIQICTLTTEKVEAEEKLSQATEELKNAKEIAAKEQEKLKLDLSRLSQEKQGLENAVEEFKKGAVAVPGLQTQLETLEKQYQSLQEASKEELSALKFQLSTEVLNHQTKLKAVSEERDKLKQEVEEQSRQARASGEALKELQAAKRDLCTKLDLAVDQVTEYKIAHKKKEEEVTQLKEDLERIQKEVSEANEQIQDYCEKLSKTKLEHENKEKKLLAELDDLTRTKQFLEERLIELLRDKDALWQKSDALEFQQKLSAEQRWLGDAEVSCCLDCKREFGWVNRRHHCRLCGRIFCYSCCNNYAMSKHTGKKERCCRACFKKSSISPNDSGLKAKEQEQSSSLLSTTFSLVYGNTAAANEASKPIDDAVFDIITDEEVGQIQQTESDQNESQTEEESLDRSLTNLNSTNNSSTFEESDDLQMQDAEICLLKSGELMAKVPFTVEDILKFGEAKKELFIKSSAYGIIPITAEESGLTISWEFSSDPKSISFSVVYKESEETPLDQCKVLIPMTRCSSHKETIRGQVKVRKTGIYILIFDNTFSRFISKKVLYHLSVQQPVVYDGSDFP